MGTTSKPITPAVIEVDKENESKNIEELDFEIPILSPRIQREYKNLTDLDVSSFEIKKSPIKTYTNEEKREVSKMLLKKAFTIQRYLMEL